MGCIEHPDPKRDPLGRWVPLRPAYVEMCEGNACAALLLADFEFWTNHRKEHGLDGWVYRTREQLRSDLWNAFGSTAIDSALKLLRGNGFLQRRRNPERRRGYDKTYQYRLLTEAIQDRIGLITHSSESEDRFWDFLDSNVGNPTSNTEEPIEEPQVDKAKSGSEVEEESSQDHPNSPAFPEVDSPPPPSEASRAPLPDPEPTQPDVPAGGGNGLANDREAHLIARCQQLVDRGEATWAS